MSRLVWVQRYVRRIEEKLVLINDEDEAEDITDIAEAEVFGKHDPDHEETLEVTLSLDAVVTDEEAQDFGPSAVDLTGRTP